MDQLRQRLDATKRLVGDASVKSTVDGVVVDIPVKVGDQVPSGATLVSLATLSDLLVEVQVSTKLVNALRLGQQAVVALPTIPVRRVEGRIATINPIPAADMTHVVQIKFDNTSSTILSGQPAQIAF